MEKNQGNVTAIEKILCFLIFFLLGFLSANLIILSMGIETPLSIGDITRTNVSPSDIILERDIEILGDRVLINIKGASLSRYEDTGSMKPVLDKGSNGIRIVPESEKYINVGDIVTFSENGYLIVHRVIEKGVDEQGVYFVTKGDNNLINDGKIRFEDIEYVTVGVIW
jgi:signal peptidase I